MMKQTVVIFNTLLNCSDLFIEHFARKIDLLLQYTKCDKKPDCINHALGTMPIGKPLVTVKHNFLALLCCDKFIDKIGQIQ